MLQDATYSIACRCDEITVEEFIEALCGNNKRILIRSGNPSQEQVERAFDKLYAEYCAETGNTVYAASLSALRRCLMLENKTMAGILAVKYEDLETLKRVGYGHRKKPEAYIKSDLMELKQAQQELAKLTQTEEQKDAKIDRKTFTRWLVSLGRFQEHRIDPKITPLSEFIEIDKQYGEYVEAYKKNLRKK